MDPLDPPTPDEYADGPTIPPTPEQAAMVAELFDPFRGEPDRCF